MCNAAFSEEKRVLASGLNILGTKQCNTVIVFKGSYLLKTPHLPALAQLPPQLCSLTHYFCHISRRAIFKPSFN